MIHITRWNPVKNCSESIELSELPETFRDWDSRSPLWIDLDNPSSDEEMVVLRKFLPVHSLTLADITKPRREPAQGAHLPKVEEFHDYLLVIVNPLPPQWLLPRNETEQKPAIHLSRRTRPQMSAILTHSILITHHYDSLSVVANVREFCIRHENLTSRGPDYLFHLILDEIVDQYAPVVERIADRLELTESTLFTSPSPELLASLIHLKKRVTFLRKTLILEREVLSRLIRGEFELVDSREIVYYRNVYDHLVRYTELIESAREMVSDMLQMHLSAVSNRVNQDVKFLTMISTIVLPMTLVAGIYGMNFQNSVWPPLSSKWGFPGVIGVMLLIGCLAAVLCRMKRWF